jgi:hypothetical protein
MRQEISVFTGVPSDLADSQPVSPSPQTIARRAPPPIDLSLD